MNIQIFHQLHTEGLITDETLDKIKTGEANRPISLTRELKALMYAGVLLLTTGLGIIVYKNLDSIGHLAIVICIALAAACCFAYCAAKAPPFSFQKVDTANILRDYILLLGCMLLLILIGYLQYQYQVFGNRWGMATFVPMVILFISAYYFDHLGVLSLAIVNLAAWAGITVTPLHILQSNDFDDARIIFTGFGLGVLLLVLSFISLRRNIKAHFSFTYKNFGVHILFISAIAAMVHFSSSYAFWFLPLAGLAVFQFLEAKKEKSFYFLVITTLYFYAGISYLVIRFLFQTSFDEGALYLALFYFIVSGLVLALFLIHYNKLFKKAT